MLLIVVIVSLMVFVPRPARHLPSKLPGGTRTPAVSLGGTHGLVLAGDGSLWSWGSDFLGWPVLGLGDLNKAANLRRIGNDADWMSISAGDSHCLAIKSDGTLWAWGMNIHGEFGNGKASRPTNSPVNVPVCGAPGNEWSQVAAGGSHSFGLRRDGTLWAWGNNWGGQLGIGSTNDSVIPVRIGAGTNWARVWAGMVNGAALQSDASLWVWGDNPALTNQLGRTEKNLISPSLLSPGMKWGDATFGNGVLLAVLLDGTLWAWGRSAHNYTTNQVPADVPARIGTESDWVSCSSAKWARELYAVLRKRDGSIWVMESSPGTGGTLRFRKLDLPNTFVAVAAGGGGPHDVDFMHDGVCAGAGLTVGGEVWTWGRGLGSLGYTPKHRSFQVCASLLRLVGFKVHWGDPKPISREQPWQVLGVESQD